jgi:hypothetical protein
MNAPSLITKISQNILDLNHPGSRANQVVSQLCPGLLSNSRSVIELFADFLNDCLGESDIGRREYNPNGAIRLNAMIEELCYRFITTPQNQALTERFLVHVDVAKQWRRAYETLKQHEYRLETAGGNAFIMKQLHGLSEQCRDIDYPVYALSKAENTIKSSSGIKARECFFPSPPASGTGFRFPISEETRKRMAQERELLDTVSTQDLSTRIIHALKRHDLAKHDPQYPVYGVESIYALIPWMISQCQGTQQEQRRPLENPEALILMRTQLREMEALNSRAERLVTRQPEPDSFELN